MQIPAWFVLAIIMTVVAIGALIVRIIAKRSAKNKQTEEAPVPSMSRREGYMPYPNDYDELSSNRTSHSASQKAVSISSLVLLGSLILALLCWGASMTTIVPAKNVGVVTSFGEPITAYDNGLHLKAPWYKVTDLDGTRQTNKYEGDQRITVRLADQSEAYVNASVQWDIQKNGATELYGDYRKQGEDITEEVRKNVVDVQLKQALNRGFETFDPLASINAEGETDTVALSDAAKIAEDVLRDELARIGGGEPQVNLVGVTVPNIEYDEETQRRIDGYRNEIAKTRVAQQLRKTNEQLAFANQEIAASIRDNPEVLVHNCLQTWAEKGDSTIPVQCFGADGDATAVKMVE